MRKLHSNYQNPRFAKPQEMDQLDKVERAGYQSKDRRIRQMIEAGERLADYRRMAFNAPDESAEPSPVQRVDFDLIDAQEYARQAVLDRRAKITEQLAQQALSTSTHEPGNPGTPEPGNSQAIVDPVVNNNAGK